MISAAMPPEFASDSLYLALGVREHRPVVCRLLHLVG
jgi:hypothetical protein